MAVTFAMAISLVVQSKLTIVIHHEHAVDHFSDGHQHNHDHHHDERPCKHNGNEDYEDENNHHKHLLSLDLPSFTLNQKFPSLILPEPVLASYVSHLFFTKDDPYYGILKPPPLIQKS